MLLNPYFNFDGNTEEVFNFYKSVFGGELSPAMRFGEMPPQPGAPPLPDDAKNKIMHMSLTLPGGQMIMGSDVVAGFGHQYKPGNDTYVSINVDSKEDADRIFNGLAGGGKVEMPMSETFWGAYFGMTADKYGRQWMINHQMQKN